MDNISTLLFVESFRVRLDGRYLSLVIDFFYYGC